MRGGQRTDEQTRAVVQEAHDRLRSGHRPTLFTDALARDEAARLAVFGRRAPAQGQGRRPVRRWRQGLAEGQVKKADKEGRGEGVAVRVVHGQARLAQGLSRRGDKPITTSGVERHNGPSRLRHQRKVRTTWALSTARRSHGWLRGLSVGLDKFCRPHSRVKIKQADQGAQRRPALAAGVTAHLWSTRAWLLRPVLGGAEIIAGHYQNHTPLAQ